jgi:hypothetical protein
MATERAFFSLALTYDLLTEFWPPLSKECEASQEACCKIENSLTGTETMAKSLCKENKLGCEKGRQKKASPRWLLADEGDANKDNVAVDVRECPTTKDASSLRIPWNAVKDFHALCRILIKRQALLWLAAILRETILV